MRYCDWCEINPATTAPSPKIRGIVALTTGSRLCVPCNNRLTQVSQIVAHQEAEA